MTDMEMLPEDGAAVAAGRVPLTLEGACGVTDAAAVGTPNANAASLLTPSTS